MEQKSMSAYEFKKGDKITRIKPSKPIKVFGEEEVEDRGYIGSELIFVGIANGCVYVQKPEPKFNFDDLDMPGFDELFKTIMGANIGLIHLPLDVWDEGWSYYIDPFSLDTNIENMTIKETMGLTKSTKALLKEYQECIDSENFERAKIIKKELDRRK